jgi:hypothetical protein
MNPLFHSAQPNNLKAPFEQPNTIFKLILGVVKC